MKNTGAGARVVMKAFEYCLSGLSGDEEDSVRCAEQSI